MPLGRRPCGRKKVLPHNLGLGHRHSPVIFPNEAPRLTLFSRRNPTDHNLIVEHLFDRYKSFLEYIVQASALHNVAAASLAIFAQMR
jgi:hypothetical protein